ncbi:MAG: hypothetical protein M3Y33_06355 [Actinomycetota bacterium]|nr:hypothetical protein [Actinomycetota bacterium]
MPACSDAECEVVEHAAEPVSVRGPGGDVMVATAQVLDEKHVPRPGSADLARASSIAPVPAISARNSLASKARSSSTSMPGPSRCSSRRAR